MYICLCCHLPGKNKSNSSDNANKIYNAPSNLRDKIKIGLYNERELAKNQGVFKLCRTVCKYSGSTNLSIHLVRWHDETCADNKDASKASTGKNT